MNTWAGLLLATAMLVAMELIAYGVHRFVMHGWLWSWHASHHRPRAGWFELNDLFALVFAALSIGLIGLGTDGHTPSYWLGLGMMGYGIIYALFHDGLVHDRIPLPRQWKALPYLRHLVQAHSIHHATHSRAGAVSFGFLYAPPLDRLRVAFRAAATIRSATGPADSDR